MQFDDGVCGAAQSFVGLGIFWAILLAITVSYVYSYLSQEQS